MSEEIAKYKKPESWALVSLEEITLPIVRVNREYQPAQEYFKYIDIETVDNVNYKLKEAKVYTWGNAPSRAQQVVKTDDILFATIRPYLKNIATIPQESNGAIASSGFCIIRPFLVNPRYIFHYILNQSFIDSVNKFAKGTSYPAVTSKIILEQKIPLPPLEQQDRIVSRIEELFSELDNGVTTLKKAYKQLEVYKQASFKNAFEGKFTQSWRKENKSQYQIYKWIKKKKEEEYASKIETWDKKLKAYIKGGKKGKKPIKPPIIKSVEPFLESQLVSFPKLPQSQWKWIKLNEITLGVEYGSSAKSVKTGKVPVLRMGNIQNGIFDWGDLVFTNSTSEISKYQLHKEDVLFNRTNSPELVGKSAVYNGEQNAIFAGYLIRINHIKTIIRAKYINYYLNSPFAKKYGNSIKTDGVNQSNINGEKLINYPIPICTLEEQDLIIQELDSRITLVDNLEKAITRGLQKIEIFKSSILRKAFEGDLVDNNSSDEPVSVLLQKIRTEKKQYLQDKKEENKLKPKNIKRQRKSDLSVLEILANTGGAILAKDLWQQSKHKENIEEFYEELKEILAKIKEVKTDTESLLSLKK